MNKPKEIILHCAATPEGKEFTAKDIDRMHKQRGFKKIGYHYVIKLDGTIEKGREENENGAHATGHNTTSIGICYIGGMDKAMKNAKDTRTEAQKESMYKLVDEMMKKYNIPLNKVYGHYQFANKACPSFKIDTFKQEFEEWKNKQSNNNITNILLTTFSSTDKNNTKTNNSIMSKIMAFVIKIIDYFLNKK